MNEENKEIVEEKKEENLNSTPEENTNNPAKKNKNGLILIVVLIVVFCLGLCGYSVVFHKQQIKNGNIEVEEDTLETDDDEQAGEVESTETTNTGNPNSGYTFKYSLNDFDSEIYKFKIMTNASTSASIETYGIRINKKVTYTYEIVDGNVTVINDYVNEKYTIRGIINAKELIAADMGQSPEKDGLFVLTNDGKVFSVKLYGDNGLITDCSQFENVIQTYDFDSSAVSISHGSYFVKNTSGGEGAILVTDSNNKQYVILSR